MRRPALLLSSLAVAALLVGCGSDDDSSDDEGGATSTGEQTSSTGEEAPGETEPDDGATTETTEAPDEPTTTSGGGGSGGDPEFCAAYGAFDESFDERPDDTVEDTQAGAVAVRDGLAAIVDIAPEELVDDLEVLVEAGEQLVEADADATTVTEADNAATEVFLDEEFVTAADIVDASFEESCPEAADDDAEG